ncbi:MAG: hypothetical protein IPM46_12275 [Flavobacteriales bacterium]|nr:hypothetical protein [Flavobacteriales bacterium]
MLAPLVAQVLGQTYSTVGTGTTTTRTSVNPFYNLYEGTRQQYYVTAAQLTAAGIAPNTNIESIGFDITIVGSGNSATLTGWNVKIHSVGTDPLTAGWVATAPAASSAPVNLSVTALGWTETYFTTPYLWNGTTDIVVETCYGNGAGVWSSTYPATRRNTAMGAGGTWTRLVYDDGQGSGICTATAAVNGGTATTNTAVRPNMRMRWVLPNPCAGTPAPGNTTTTSASACVGVNFTLGLQNATIGTGVTYQWESADDAAFTVNLASLGTASTQVTNQSSAKYYRCLVSCLLGGGIPPSTYSDWVFIPMSGFVPATFEAAPFNCWSTTNAGGLLAVVTGASGYGVGTNSVRWNFYADGAGNVRSLDSPTLPATPAGYQVRFDAAGTFYSGDGSFDSLVVETSLDGLAWAVLAPLANNASPLMTLPGGTGGNFVPNAAQWVTLSYPLPTGTVQVRFRGKSGFGNSVFVDNIAVEQIPVCFAPSLAGITGTLFDATTATINWTSEPTATGGYDVELRQGGAPGFGGEVFAGSTLLTTIQASVLAVGQTYEIYVRSDCDANGESGWAGPKSYYHGYCAAGGDNTFGLNPQVNNVQVAGINDGNPSASTTLGYVDLTSVVGNMAPGGSYPFQASTVVFWENSQFLVWIDWNEDLDFNDLDENVMVGAVGVDGVGWIPSYIHPTPIVCPVGTSPGNKRMRVRWQYNDPTEGAFPNNTPCGNATFSQVLDFTVNVCAPPQATTTVNDGGCTGTFTVDVDIANFGSAGSGQILWSLNGVPQTPVDALTATTYTLDNDGAGFDAINDRVTISVSNGTACSLVIGDHYSNCPRTFTCYNVIPVEHRYRANDPRTFTFTNDLAFETVTVNFISGCIEPGDAVIVYDAVGGNQVGQSAPGATSLAGFSATGSSTIHIVIQSDAQNNYADGYCTDPWLFEIICTPGCTPVNATVTPVTNCSTYDFTINVTNLDCGDGGPMGIRYIVGVDPGGHHRINLRWQPDASGSRVLPHGCQCPGHPAPWQ